MYHIKTNKNGFSLIELMIVIGLMAIMMFILSSFMVTQQREAKALSEGIGRTELQRFVTSALGDGSVCTAELATPSTYTGTATAPYAVNLAAPGTTEIQLTQLHQSANPSSPFLVKVNESPIGMASNIKVSSITFKNFTNAGTPNIFYADLVITLSQEQLVRSIKPASIKTVIVTEVGTGNIRSCSLTASMNAKQSCLDLGGQWLEATQTGRHMPVPRCNMTDDTYLNASENPDNVPTNGVSLSDGSTITECYYSAGGNRKTTYRCVPRAGNFTGDTCAYNPATMQWKVIRYVNASPTAVVRRICDRGVLVSKKSVDVIQLRFNEPLENAFDTELSSSSTWYDKSNYLQTVTRCNVSSRTEKWVSCSNPEKPSDAKAGKALSCIWVTNGKLSLGTVSPPSVYRTYYTNYNLDNPSQLISATSYTGWIRVNSNRVIKLTTGNVAIKEAQGVPCYGIELNKQNAPDPISLGTDNPLTLLGAGTSGEAVKACYIKASTLYAGENATGTTGDYRYTILACDQSSAIDAMPISPSADINDQFPKLSCWNYSAVKLRNYNTVTPFYSGWVYTLANLSTSASLYTQDANYSIQKNGALAPALSITGYPCTGGVQY